MYNLSVQNSSQPFCRSQLAEGYAGILQEIDLIKLLHCQFLSGRILGQYFWPKSAIGEKMA